MVRQHHFVVGDSIFGFHIEGCRIGDVRGSCLNFTNPLFEASNYALSLPDPFIVTKKPRKLKSHSTRFPLDIEERNSIAQNRDRRWGGDYRWYSRGPIINGWKVKEKNS